MTRQNSALCLLALALLVSACQQKEKPSLSRFIADAAKMKGSEIEPLPNIKPVEPFAYSAQEFADPFNIVNLKPTKVVSARSGTGPDVNRRREPLENYPLDSLRMVGTLFREHEERAIIKTPEGAVLTVVVGKFMGQNYGKIISIDENEIAVKEQVLNSAGTWVGRDASIKVDQ
jgi:type IV pilus assembly protein PilP